MKVSDDILAVLTAALVDGHSLTLTGMLDRKLYERTNKVLEAAGGKWNRKAKAHVFEMPAEDAIEQIVLSGEITIPQDFGYFPTPPAVVERLVELAEVRSHHRSATPKRSTASSCWPRTSPSWKRSRLRTGASRKPTF
jgi:hypothetical protein